MEARRARWLWIVAIGGLLLIPPARAELPDSCANGPCHLESEFVVFLDENPTYGITATFVDCTYCSPPGLTGQFDIDATLRIDFGPYDPATGCTDVPDANAMQVEISTSLRPLEGDGGVVLHYYPSDPNEEFEAWPMVLELRTNCVDAAFLDYRFPKLLLTDAGGAWTDDPLTSEDAATLSLPDDVRSTYGSRYELPPFKVTQGIDFNFAQSHDPASSFRIWPEALPFRLGPRQVTYVPGEVSWTFDPVAGPHPYKIARPDPSTLPAAGYDIKTCSDPDSAAGDLCTTTPIWNAGYLDCAAWSPANARFDPTGLDVELSLDSGDEVVYETLFPRGTWLELRGPATIFVEDGAIADGAFDAGQAWLQVYEGMGWCEEVYKREFDLFDGQGRNPQVTPDGGIVAGIVDLNPVEGSVHQNVKWMRNQAYDLGCGTLYAPPLANDVLAGADVVGPQHEWLRSAEAADDPDVFSDPVRGRGVYAGFNYNRDKVCVEGDPAHIGEFCGVDGDCGAAGLCQADRWSPLCPPIPTDGFHPGWSTYFQDNFLQKEIHPEQSGREMAFVARASGVTGVFDAGNDPFEVLQPFHMEFNSFGHAFRASQSEWADTIIRGGLMFPWPSNTTIPFNDMTMCNCGAVKAAGSGEPPTENRLAYWDALFYPYGLTFLESSSDDCAAAEPTSCQDGAASAAAVCVEATMPIPHFKPVPTVKFRIDGNGNADQIVPLDTPVFEFERTEPPVASLTPYEYAAEQFRLNSWVAAGMPGEGEGYGYFDSEGDLALPLFGQVPAGIQVRSLDGYQSYEVNLHEEGDPDLTAPYVEVTKKAAADTLGLSYRVDYFRPDWTADQGDGNNENGRGLMLGYSGLQDGDRNLDLGSIKIPSTVVMTPDTIVADVGVPASMRLWGATTTEGRAQLDSILPPENLQPAAVNAYEAGLAALGIPGEDLPPPDEAYVQSLYDSGAIHFLALHPTDNARPYNTDGSLNDPGMNATNLTGYFVFSGDEVERVFLDSDMSTNGQFFALDRSTLTVDRHVKHNSPAQPIAQLGRRNQPGNMALPGKMSVPFPDVPGMQWDFDYDFSGATPVFRSLTGSLDLTQGGLSGIGFDRAGLTLKYWNDGDWYFDAGLELNFNGYGAYGDILLGNTKNLDPLWAKDPTVADFLGNVPSFRGGYARVGVSGRIFNYGCLLRVSAGLEVGGWYITDSYGAKLRGWVSGRGACVVSVRGDLTLLGGEVGDRFKMSGFMWVAGGIGFCDEEDWDTPADVLDDGWCLACVVSGSVTGITPPKFKLSMEGPDFECSP
jgi:hypothetical protein